MKYAFKAVQTYVYMSVLILSSVGMSFAEDQMHQVDISELDQQAPGDEVGLRNLKIFQSGLSSDCGKLNKKIKCLEKKIDELINKPDCNSATAFGSAEVNQPGGYVITKPGVYCLKEDVVFTPPNTIVDPANPVVAAAITVLSSNVIIKMGDHRLAQFTPADPKQQMPYVVGILVPDLPASNPQAKPIESVYLEGDQAIIDGFSMFGVRIFANTFDIRISNLTVKNVGALASAEFRPFLTYLPHSSFDVSSMFPGADKNPFNVAGIAIGETDFAGMGPVFFTDVTTFAGNQVGSVVLEDVSCLNNFYRGLFVAFTTDVTINNCHFDDTWSDQPGLFIGQACCELAATTPVGGDFEGIFSGNVAGVVNMRVSNSTFNNTQLRGNGKNTFDFTTDLGSGFMGGVQAFGGVNTVWDNCQFNNTSNKFVSTFFANITAGFVSGGMRATAFYNCSFDGTRAVTGARGVDVSGSGPTVAQEADRGNLSTLFVNCTARNIEQIANQLSAPVPTMNTQAVGFASSFGTNVVFENCVASDIKVSGPMLATGLVAGFRIAGAANRIDENKVLRGCTAQRCLAVNGGQSLGFAVIASNANPVVLEKTIVFEDCIAEGNTAGEYWKAAVTYAQGEFVLFGTPAAVYRSLQSNNLNNVPNAPGSTFWAIASGTASIGCGFCLEGDSSTVIDERRDLPWSLIGCKALFNKGATSAVIGGVPQYSAGFSCFGAQRASLFECEALSNIYGFVFHRSDRNTIRNCRADNNLEAVSLIGEGFSDFGAAGTPEVPGVSTSAFQNNTAFRNGAGNIHDGINGNYNIITKAAIVPPLPPAPAVHEPLLAGSISTAGSFVATPSFPTYLPNLHNISTIL